MSGRTKIGVAAVMMLLVFATAPALLCLEYFSQKAPIHKCCPSKTAPVSKVVPACCVHSPALAPQSAHLTGPECVPSAQIALEQTAPTAGLECASVLTPDTSPPLCSSILRI